MFVTAQTDERVDLLRDLAEAVTAIEVDVWLDGDVLVVDGARVVPHLVARAHPTPADVSQLVAAAPGRMPAVLVADRLSEAGRDVLRKAGWGWLDRRGHLRLWAPGVRIEVPLPSVAGQPARGSTGNPWTTVGLELALAALCEPDQPVTARRIAPIIGRSVGATHELIGRFAELGLIGRKSHRPLLPELFWETAARWPDDGWIGLPVELAELSAKVGVDELLRVDERAATLGGARIAAVGDLPARCYVRSAGALRRARNLVDRDHPVRCWVREPPVRWLPDNADHPPDAEHPWWVAHPILCALRLAADESRGHEIVEAWGIVPGPAAD